MTRITTMFPEDPRQPFYNPNSSEIVPLARLYIRKTKTIPRNCDDKVLQSQLLDVSENTEDELSRRKTTYIINLLKNTIFEGVFCMKWD